MRACQSLGNPQNEAQRQQTPMSETPVREDAAHIYCSTDTRNRVRRLKRGGETYDELLRRMAHQYDPKGEHTKEGADD